MKKKNIPAAVASTNAYEALEDWARSRVQVWLQELLEDEVTQFLGREKSERSPNRRGYRNGHGKPRRFAMMNGTMEVRRPRVRNTAERFESQILPYFRRKSKQLGELLPDLYLHGLATGDFEQAMRGLLGAGAPLSRASIQRLKSTWHRGDRTLQEIASKHQVHPNQVSTWKRQTMEELGEMFSNGVERRRLPGPARHRRVGRLLQRRTATLGSRRKNPGRGLPRRPTGAATATGRSIQVDSGKMSGNRNTP